jgi:hypothetical protein
VILLKKIEEVNSDNPTAHDHPLYQCEKNITRVEIKFATESPVSLQSKKE